MTLMNDNEAPAQSILQRSGTSSGRDSGASGRPRPPGIIDAAARMRSPKTAREACEHHIRLAGDFAIMEYVRRNPELVRVPAE